MVRIACRTPGIEKAPWACAAKQALSAMIWRSLDAVFMVVQPIGSLPERGSLQRCVRFMEIFDPRTGGLTAARQHGQNFWKG